MGDCLELEAGRKRAPYVEEGGGKSTCRVSVVNRSIEPRIERCVKYKKIVDKGRVSCMREIEVLSVL